jgi:hypothetical protein
VAAALLPGEQLSCQRLGQHDDSFRAVAIVRLDRATGEQASGVKNILHEVEYRKWDPSGDAVASDAPHLITYEMPVVIVRRYSERMATIGCTEAARRAGARLATTATSMAIAAPAT